VSAYRRQGVSAFAYHPKANIGEQISLYFLYPAELKCKVSVGTCGRGGKRIGVSASGERVGLSAYRRRRSVLIRFKKAEPIVEILGDAGRPRRYVSPAADTFLP
jgi:hypothetical protein